MDDTGNTNKEASSVKAREQCYRACYEDRAVQAREQCYRACYEDRAVQAIERVFLQPKLSFILQTDFENPNVDKKRVLLLVVAPCSVYVCDKPL